jgi:hypothetical protein
MLDTVRKLIRNDQVPFVHLEGKKQYTKIQWIGNVQKNPNSLFDPFSVLSWELHSDRVQFFVIGVSLGYGYLGDVVGATIDLTRNTKGQIASTEPATGTDEPAAGTSCFSAPITAAVTPFRLPAVRPAGNTKSIKVATVLLKGTDRITEVHFQYMEKLEEVLLCDRTNTRYRINPDTKLEIIMPDGKAEAGWVCDETGQTLTITRNVKALALKRDKKGVPELDEKGQLIEVEVGVNWSGRLGKYLTNDKATAFWASTVSGKEKLIFGIMCFLIGQAIFAVFKI